jgi:hypothetical protein
MNRSDLEKVATKIIRLHVDGGKTPSEAACRCCQESSLNDEQVKRVVEMANTGLFLEKFKGTSGNKNRFVDFDVIDPLKIISSMMAGASPVSRRSSQTITMSITTPKGTSVRRIVNKDPGLDTNRSFFFDDIPNEKVAHYSDVPLDYEIPLVRTKTASATKEVSPFNESKTKSRIEDIVYEAGMNCDTLATKIASMYKDIYSREKYSSFEENALATFGAPATYVLQAVRSKLGMDLLKRMPTDMSVKTASDRYVSDKNMPGIPEAGVYLENLKAFVKVSAPAALSPDAILALGAGLIGRDFVAPITSGYGYQLATQLGPSAFYRVKGFDRMMEQTIDKGMETAFGAAEGIQRDLKDSYNAKVWKKRRMHAVKKMLKDNPDIASSDKGRVRDAVNTVARYAPKISQDPSLLTGMVNQMIHSETGAIDPQTVSELVKAEKEFRFLDKPPAFRG